MNEPLTSRKGRKEKAPEKNRVTGTPNREFKILGWLWPCPASRGYIFAV